MEGAQHETKGPVGRTGGAIGRKQCEKAATIGKNIKKFCSTIQICSL